MAPAQDHDQDDDDGAVAPLRHVVEVEAIPARGLEVHLIADEGQRADIAVMLDLVSVPRLEARLTVTAEGARVRVRGALEADVVQTCVVTLEPVPATLNEAIEWVYAPEEEAVAALRKAGLDPEMDDPSVEDMAGIDLAMLSDPDALPEPIFDGCIDIGRAVYEEFAVALEPYPRKPGAEFEPPREPEGFGSPFGALARLKPRT